MSDEHDSAVQPELLLKVLLVGESGSGKSSILQRFADGSFSPTYMSTIGVDFKVKYMQHKGRDVKVQVWDTAGQERFRTVTTSYYRGAHACVVVYDQSDPKSFAKVRYWMSEIKANAPESVAVVLVGNKADLPEIVKESEGQALSEELSVRFFRTSAKTGQSVTEAFEQLVADSMESNFGAGQAQPRELPVSGGAGGGVNVSNPKGGSTRGNQNCPC